MHGPPAGVGLRRTELDELSAEHDQRSVDAHGTGVEVDAGAVEAEQLGGTQPGPHG
ncbi:hypothetical protein [Rhodococcus sp. MS13]|uniref:hypothetical protein n=1 Tax=Rhodococcus sp. MS13 TaxID=2579940 RepID=UPI001F5B036F|nr:hypothetical protein [Rhodococcus sp. MS13]